VGRVSVARRRSGLAWPRYGGITLTARQAARERIIAPRSSSPAGGYDAVRCGTSRRADVALGTIYHYFSSRITSSPRPSSSDDVISSGRSTSGRRRATTVDRVLDLLDRTTTGMRRNETLSAAILTGFMSTGDEVAACQLEVHDVWSRYLESAFDDSVEPTRRKKVIRTLEHVWNSGLVGWTFGWMTLDEAVAELEDAARLLLEPPSSGA
jgi:AcrR family transcriptional regulator